MSEDQCRKTVRLNTITGTCKKCGTLTEFASPSLEYGGSVSYLKSNYVCPKCGCTSSKQ